MIKLWELSVTFRFLPNTIAHLRLSRKFFFGKNRSSWSFSNISLPRLGIDFRLWWWWCYDRRLRRLFCRRIQAFYFIFRFLVLNLTGMFRAWPFWKRRTTIPWKLKMKKMKKTCSYRNPIRKYFVRPGTSGVLDFFLIPHWTPGWWLQVNVLESLAKKKRNPLVRHIVGIWEVGTADLLPSIAHSGPATI